MDRADRGRAGLSAPGNVFYFVADLAAATSWYSSRLGVEPVTRAHRGPKTIMTGERLCQMLDRFDNLFGLRRPPA